MVHLVYCDNIGKRGERTLDRILSGEKTAVVRSAAGRKIPHSRVFAGETLYFMEKGSSRISASATVTDVKNYVKLTEDEIDGVFAAYAGALSLTSAQRERWHKKCICIVCFKDVKPLEPPLEFDKQSNMDDWLIIEKIEDVLVGTSIPYNYAQSKF